MKKLPLISTLVVALAVALLIGLGVWQLERKAEKEAILATYAQAAAKPPIAFPAQPNAQDRDTYLFRQTSGYCALVMDWTAEAGSGGGAWKHVASCFTGDQGAAPMLVDVGENHSPVNPHWEGGQVDGLIVPDKAHVLRVVAQVAAPGLKASTPPRIEDVPNNHLAYALTWFAFALIAVVIYILALRHRNS